MTTPAEAKKKDEAWLAETLSAEDQAAFNKEYVPQSWQTYRDERGDFEYDSPIYTNQSYPWQNFEARNDSANAYAATVYNPSAITAPRLKRRRVLKAVRPLLSSKAWSLLIMFM